MKLSNNAIKFLMAQYRAIYKNAYFKGIASAVVLTAGLAAGQAQAADTDGAAFEKLTGDITQASGDKFNIKGAGATFTNKNTFTLTINHSGAGAITASGSSSGDITVNANKGTIILDHKKGNLTITSTSGAATVDLLGLQVKQGTVKIKNESGAATLTAGNITIAGTPSGSSGNFDKGTIILGSGSGGVATLGAKTSVIQLDDGGVLKLAASGSGAANAVVLGTFSGAGTGGVIDVTSGSGTLKTDGTIAGVTINVGAEKVLNVDVSAATTDTLTISKGTISLSGSGSSGAKVTVSGNMILGKTVELKAAHASGGGNVTVGSGSAGSLTLSKETAKGLLGSKGQLTIGASGALTLTPELDGEFVDLEGLAFSGNAANSKINVVASGSVGADKLRVSSKIENGNTVTLKANTLELGSTSYDGTNAFGFSGATAKEVNLKFSGDSFVLKDKLTISNVIENTDGTKTAGKGSISGALSLDSGASVTVDGAVVTATDAITVGSGSLAVSNTKGTVTSSLTVNGPLTLLASETNHSGSITVSGSGTSTATLDLTKANLTIKGSGSGSAHTAKANKTITAQLGTVKVTGQQVKSLFDQTASGDSGAQFIASGAGGTIEIVGDLTDLDAKYIGSGVTNEGIKITSGDVVIGGELALINVSGSLTAGQSGGITAGTLTLENQSGDGTYQGIKIGSGNYTVLEGLQTTSPVGLTLESGSTLNLGKAEATGNGGNIDFNKVTAASGSKFNVVNGDWGTKINNYELASGAALTIGSASGDAASLTGDKLTVVNSSGTNSLAVNQSGVLTLSQLDLQSGTITVNGDMTVDGKELTTKDSGGADVVTGYGVNIAGTVKVSGPDATFTLGSTALQALSDARFVQDSASGSTAADLIVDYKPKASGSGSMDIISGKFTLEDFATLKLGFTENDTFTLDQLKALRKEFFGNTQTDAISGGFISLGNAKIDGVSITDGKIAVTELEKFNDFTDFVMADLNTATVTGATASNTINGNIGNIEADAGNKKVNVGVATLNDCKGKGFAYAADSGELVGITVKAGGTLGLNNGGNAGDITLTNSNVGRDTILLVSGGSNSAVTNINEIEGKGAATELQLSSGIVNVKRGVTAGSVQTSADTQLNITSWNAINSLNLTDADAKSVFNGNVHAETGLVNVSGSAEFGGTKNYFANNAEFAKDVTFKNGETTFDKILDISKSGASIKVVSGGTLNVNTVISGGKTATIAVGADNTYDVDGTTVLESGSTGYLYTQYLNLSGGTLLVDPEYGMKTSVAAVGAFADAGHYVTNDAANLGTVDGNVILGKNSALGVQKDVTLSSVQSFIANYQDANGSLTADGVSNVLLLDGKLTVATDSKVILDGQNKSADIVAALGTNGSGYGYDSDNNGKADVKADLYLGNGSVLALDNGALNGAVEFEAASASIYAPAAAKGYEQGKIVLAGEAFLKSRDISLFTAGAVPGSNGVDGTPASATNVTVQGVAGQDDIRVETMNGLMYFTLVAGKALDASYNLSLDTSKVATAYNGASVPMKEFLVGYAAQTRNWQQAYSTDPDTGAAVAERVELLGNVVADQSLFTVDPKTGELTFSATAPQEFQTENPITGFTAVDGVVYSKASNAFLEKVARNTSGLAADQAARMGVFGGAPQAALTATSTTSDAVAGLFGMGNAAAALTYADNGQGTGMWVTPVYRSADSDGFGADGLEYGADVSLFGVALGGDYSLGNGMRVGAMLNIGSGDADGQGAASAVTNDFNYFGGALYAGYSMDALSIVADLSYTTVDSDVEANTEAGQVSTSFDTTTLSAGVTGQYAMNFGGVDVAPHAGLRFTRIDMDDYVITSAEFGDVGNFATSSANVFSIPVGVTISKEYAMDNWSVKPAFDLTLTGNFGDDTADGTVTWTNVTNWDVATKNEFVDSFTYGASMGVAAKSGNMGLGFGLNYTGSSNVKEFGANANVRYVF
ncbi:autotransporter outer membrane beta-barrel domain-containing protein [Anaerobiospirillum sp. NML120449]|uniref:autotransporter outer membrane beta-barrel domain-containing protein n=1 Tax=Anaerobiospirillum sp. NML120449 TaxID=2932817 RepID=UPI001FF41907|nr:autotransporter outer membrane beta-barrel domain-containing protein [Anaerobiospirillum sp. NML120449]MCK0526477.1 autotransporter outer membrane beta-barrel domain-containing protein [Anaerobiospirillum sp. NML120449]